MSNKIFTEAQAIEILKTFYPQIQTASVMQQKRDFFVFQVKYKGSLIFSGHYFKSVGLNDFSNVILLEITFEKLEELETELKD